MGALLSMIVKMAGQVALYSVIEGILSRAVDTDENSVIDEIGAVGVVASIFGISKWRTIAASIKALPIPVTVTTAAGAADFLEEIYKNKKGLATLNSKLGGFAPLFISLATKVNLLLRRRTVIYGAATSFIVSFMAWLIWTPNLIQQFGDLAGFAPEQVNAMLEDLGISYRVPISARRAAETANEIAQAERNILGAIGKGFEQVPKTRITMTKQSKPALFTGVLFSSRVKSTGVFERVLDDKITDKADLKDDAQQNMNRWLASMPARLIYQIRLANNPYDETGIQLTGYWATLSIAYQKISGMLVYLDTIPLGPVDPQTYMPKATETEAIQFELPKLLTATEISAIELPSGDFNIVDKTGTAVPITFTGSQGLASPAAPIKSTASATLKELSIALGQGDADRVDQVMSAAGVTQQASPAAVPTASSASAAVQAPATMPAQASAPIAPFTPAANSVNPLPIFLPNPPPPTAPIAFSPALPNGLRIPSQYQLRTPESILHIRESPRLTGKILGDLPNGWYGNVIGYGGTSEGITWVKISQAGYPDGYASARYLFFVGN